MSDLCKKTQEGDVKMERKEDATLNLDFEEIKLIKLILILDAKIARLEQKIDQLGDRYDFYKQQIADKDAYLRKLVYLIISILGVYGGVSSIIKLVIGGSP